MVFDPNYDATPLSTNIYELVYRFINTNDLMNAGGLPAFLKKELNGEFSDHAILNRVGYKKMEKKMLLAGG